MRFGENKVEGDRSGLTGREGLVARIRSDWLAGGIFDFHLDAHFCGGLAAIGEQRLYFDGRLFLIERFRGDIDARRSVIKRRDADRVRHDEMDWTIESAIDIEVA